MPQPRGLTVVELLTDLCSYGPEYPVTVRGLDVTGLAIGECGSFEVELIADAPDDHPEGALLEMVRLIDRFEEKHFKCEVPPPPIPIVEDIKVLITRLYATADEHLEE